MSSSPASSPSYTCSSASMAAFFCKIAAANLASSTSASSFWTAWGSSSSICTCSTSAPPAGNQHALERAPSTSKQAHGSHTRTQQRCIATTATAIGGTLLAVRRAGCNGTATCRTAHTAANRTACRCNYTAIRCDGRSRLCLTSIVLLGVALNTFRLCVDCSLHLQSFCFSFLLLLPPRPVLLALTVLAPPPALLFFRLGQRIAILVRILLFVSPATAVLAFGPLPACLFAACVSGPRTRLSCINSAGQRKGTAALLLCLISMVAVDDQTSGGIPTTATSFLDFVCACSNMRRMRQIYDTSTTYNSPPVKSAMCTASQRPQHRRHSVCAGTSALRETSIHSRRKHAPAKRTATRCLAAHRKRG